MAMRPIRMHMYTCDNPNCRKEKVVPEGEIPNGYNGKVQWTTDIMGREVTFYACTDACVVPAIKERAQELNNANDR